MRYFILGICLMLSGCAFLEATGTVAGVIGKVGWEASKVVGKVAWTGTKMVGQTASQANNSVRPARTRSNVKKRPVLVGPNQATIPLEKEGNSYFVEAKINNKVWGRFLLDTGASAIQISKSMAKRLSIGRSEGDNIPVTLASGHQVKGRVVILGKVDLGGVAVEDVPAVILDYESRQSSDGLLGMTFLEHFVFEIDAKEQSLILRRR